jgi:predicted ATPase
MPLIEGFRVTNYRTLRDVTLGKLSGQHHGEPLSPLTVVIGKNGAGKSTLLDAFGFVADCLAQDVEVACDRKERGGFDRLRSRGMDGPISFEIYYREAPNERPITYELAIGLDKAGRPFVESELLNWPSRRSRLGTWATERRSRRHSREPSGRRSRATNRMRCVTRRSYSPMLSTPAAARASRPLDGPPPARSSTSGP